MATNWRFAERIYDPIFLQEARRVLADLAPTDLLAEAQFLARAQDYFQGVFQRGANHEIDQMVARMEFASVERRFRLIEEQGPTQSYFVLLDDKAHQLWDQYQALRQIPNKLKRRKRFQQIKRTFAEYVISVFEQPDPEQPILPLTLDRKAPCYYDREVGFTRNDEGSTFSF